VSSRPCCAVRKETPGARIADGDPREAASSRRGSGYLFGSIFPSAILVLLPKCPACIAAYVAMGTGVGLSFTTATYLRLGIETACVLAIGYFGARYARRLVRRITEGHSVIQSVSKRCSFQGSPYMW
jgi:hypothetical protein